MAVDLLQLAASRFMLPKGFTTCRFVLVTDPVTLIRSAGAAGKSTTPMLIRIDQ